MTENVCVVSLFLIRHFVLNLVENSPTIKISTFSSRFLYLLLPQHWFPTVDLAPVSQARFFRFSKFRNSFSLFRLTLSPFDLCVGPEFQFELADNFFPSFLLRSHGRPVKVKTETETHEWDRARIVEKKRLKLWLLCMRCVKRKQKPEKEK